MGKKKLSDTYPIIRVVEDTVDKFDMLGQRLNEGDLVLYSPSTSDTFRRGSIVKKTTETFDYRNQGVIQHTGLMVRMQNGNIKSIWTTFGMYKNPSSIISNCVKINKLVDDKNGIH